MIEAAFPAATIAPTATATNTTTTLTFTASEAAAILPGMTVTGAGISANGLVVSVSSGVVTISGTITTLTTSKYTFTLPIYGSLHTGSPSTTGANECPTAGGSYTRQSVTFGAPVAGVKTSTNAQSWTSMPSTTVADFGFWTTATPATGTYLGGGVLSSSLTVPVGATVYAASGAIILTAGG